MSKHTPGPWIVYADTPSLEPNWHIVTSESRRRVIANIHIEPNNEMDSANASLIAAAPELLDFAKRITAWLEALAKASDERSKDRRFPSLAEANEADAKNYRATAAHGLKAIAKAEGRK